MHAVPLRTGVTFMGTIQVCIAPRSIIIISNMWASYQEIETMIDMNYAHEMANHTGNSADPTTGPHTQTVEFRWQVYKMQTQRQCDTHNYSFVSLFGGKGTGKRAFSLKIINGMSPFHPLQ